MSKNSADYIIIGGGLTGLITAALLENAGQNYVLFEAQDEWGGLARGQIEQGVGLDYGLKSIPVGNISTNPLLLLKNKLDLKFNVETVLESPLTLQKSGWTPFVGFGDSGHKKVAAVLEYYTRAPRLMVSDGWMHLINELLKLIPEKKRKLHSIITQVETQENRIQSLKINGESTWTGKHFITTLPPKQLLKLIPADKIQNKSLQKINKSESFVSLSLDLATTQRITELKNLVILQDEDFYVIGQFVSNADPLRQSKGLQISSWLTLVDEETAQDDEAVSKTIKQMKKQIKKAFPALFEGENPTWERLLVTPEALGSAHSFDHQIENLTAIGARIQSDASWDFLNQSISSALLWIEGLNHSTSPETHPTAIELA